MLSCKEVAQLVSESLDHKLPLRKRIGVRVHLFMCAVCCHYRQQMLALRKVIRLHHQTEESGKSTCEEILPEIAKERIRQALEKQA